MFTKGFKKIVLFILLFQSISVHSQNIILILTDDQGFGDLGFTGNPYLNTANLDSLAKKGIFFDYFYVSPVCSPTRAELLTGKYHQRSKVISTSQGGERIDLIQTLFPEILKDNGYKTALFGKWHSGQQPPYHPNSRGFDEFYGYCSGHLGSYFDSEIEHNGKLIKSDGYLTDNLIDRSLEFIHKNRDQPFFLFLSLNTPHSPMQVPDKWWNLYKNRSIKEARSDYELNHTRAAYAMIENIDWNIGRLLDGIENYELQENTTIIFLGDNGPNGNRWNANLKGIKGSTDEGGVRSPLIIYHPKVKSSRIRSIASSIDIAPTILSLVNINPKEFEFDGIDLSSLWKYPERVYDRYLIQYWNGQTSIRSSQFRLSSENKMFDIINDPSQLLEVNNSIEKGKMENIKRNWLDKFPNFDQIVEERPLPIIHTKTPIILPARESKFDGDELSLSNRWPNDSFIDNWKSDENIIYWPIEVYEDLILEPTIYYTADESSLGTVISIEANESKVEKIITEPFDPLPRGMENDRVPREESYVKDFKEMIFPAIRLKKGVYDLKLRRKSSSFKGEINIKRILLRSKKI
jgi:arylsulfatase A-like enzyme